MPAVSRHPAAPFSMHTPSPVDEGPLNRSCVLTEAQAARFLSLSLPQLRRLRRQGEAPDHVKLSVRRIGYQVAALLAFLDSKTVSNDGGADE